ncbi:hypothetical protein H2198_008569 [Neophaeococcomyces mojaviensis]|uniref:Uncharacterized protein n=1 Tax=Neophaeococcomyces mojaviensis TaxID=3383035 RepID=A0ACC2ZWY8_9EURO|nr:hypothetical protein H2198_008569 [Knufia sp. JES_112]
MIDLALVYLAGLEIWQFMFRASRRDQQYSFLTRFKKLESTVRNQRLWQTLLLCGPLLLSAVASIVKTYLLSALGSRLDFTWNIVPFILWVKIENYCIPIAATAPVFRLFIRSFIDQRATDGSYGTSGTDRKHSKFTDKLELSQRSRNRNGTQNGDKDFGALDEVTDTNGSVHGSEIDLVPQNGGSMVIEVKREYHVRVEEQNGKDSSLAQPR